MSKNKLILSNKLKYLIGRILAYFCGMSILLGIVFFIVKKILMDIAWYNSELKYPVINLIAAYLFEAMFIIWLIVTVYMVVYLWRQFVIIIKQKDEEAIKSKNDMLAYLAHDLRTPLTSIVGYVTLLRQEENIDEIKSQEYLKIIAEKSNQLENMLDEFFEITTLETQNAKLEITKVNLTTMLKQIVYEYTPIFREKQMEIIYELNEDVDICCDVSKMERVFDNLIRNAMKYAPKNSKIKIIAKRQGEQYHMVFANQASSMKEIDLNKIFDEFVRLDKARGNIDGAGLGLSIVKNIVELHEGKIWAEKNMDLLEIHIIMGLSN